MHRVLFIYLAGLGVNHTDGDGVYALKKLYNVSEMALSY